MVGTIARQPALDDVKRLLKRDVDHLPPSFKPDHIRQGALMSTFVRDVVTIMALHFDSSGLCQRSPSTLPHRAARLIMLQPIVCQHTPNEPLRTWRSIGMINLRSSISYYDAQFWAMES